MVTVKGATTSSRLLIQNAQVEDSGEYSCIPSNSKLSTVRVHILNGKYILDFEFIIRQNCRYMEIQRKFRITQVTSRVAKVCPRIKPYAKEKNIRPCANMRPNICNMKNILELLTQWIRSQVRSSFRSRQSVRPREASKKK